MADGKVVIETGLDTDGIKKDLNQAEKQINSSTKKMKVTFEELSKQSGRSVEELKNKAKSLAEEYQKQGMNLPSAYKKAYNEMGVYSENAAKKMRASAEKAEEASGKSADKTSEKWDKSFKETQQDSESAQKKIKEDAEKEKQAHERASERSKEAWSKAFGTIKSIAGAAVKTTAAAITGVSAALMGAGGYAVKVGSDFEAAMSKVEAISGATASQMEALTQKAKEMGASTKFSATESAEAFQYMAMAGWDSAQMIDGIGGIMNLAAADGLDLATTSDIVTDALTAFGLAAADSTHFADVLATASSSANTNVSMLGESFKYVAPIAGAMNYSVEDVSKALGLMANASVKGSMAGTSLKTALSNLASPTNKMREAMNQYGISLTDSKGNMKSLDEVMLNLRESLGDLSEQEQTAAASTIFGKEAMAGMLAIINASEQDYKKLSEAIANADGTAQKMADTMNDNLQGKVTLAKSALEGLGIQFYETVQEDMKNAVEEGTSYIDQLSNAFTNGGLEAAVDEAGDIVADLAVKIAQSAPNMINASTDLIQAFIAGLVKNKKQLKFASREIVEAICDGLIKLLPKKMQEPAKKAMSSLGRTFQAGTKNLLNIGKSTLELLGKIFEKLADNMDTVVPVAVRLIATIKGFQMVNGPVQAVVATFIKLKKTSDETGLAMSALNAIMNANPATLIAGAIAVLIGGLASYIATADRADASQDAFNQRMDELGASIENNRNDLDALKESIGNTSTSINNSTAPIEKWRDKLGEAFDSTGKVKDGCEDMANYILQQLNDAMGTSYELTAEGFIQNNEGVKQSLDDVNKTIDEYVQNLKQKSLQEAVSSQYTEALQRQGEATGNLNEAQKEYNAALEEYAKVKKSWEDGYDLEALEKAEQQMEKTREELQESSKAAAEAKSEITGLDAVMNTLAEGTPESVQKALEMYAQIPIEADKAADGVTVSQSNIQQALNSTDYYKMSEGFRLAVTQIEESGGEIPASLRDCIVNALAEFERLGPEGETLMRSSLGQIMEEMSDQIPSFQGAAVTTSEEIINKMRSYLVDSGAMRATGKEGMLSFESGLSEGTPGALEAAGQAVSQVTEQTKQKAAEKKPEMTASGADLEYGFTEGAASVDTTTVPVQKVDEATAGVINAAMAGVPLVQQAAVANAGAINTGYQATDVTTEAAQTGNNSVQALIDAITALNASVRQASASIGQSAAQGLSSADMGSAFSEQGSNAVSKVSGSILKNVGSVTSAASSLGKSSSNALKGVNLGASFQSQAKNAVAMFCAAIKGQTTAAMNATRGLGTGVSNALTSCNLGNIAMNQGRLFGGSFASGIRGQNGTVSSASLAIGNSAKNALNGFGSTGYGIGVQFSSGLARGIRAGEGGIAAAAAAVANAAAKAAMANLDIHSPSRVGGYIGRMFDKGIELDVKKGASGIEKAVEGVTDLMKINPSELLESMRGAFGSTINRIVTNQTLRSASVRAIQDEGKAGDVYQEIHFHDKTESPVEVARAIRKEGRRLAFTR